jgi:hypothetical protein
MGGEIREEHERDSKRMCNYVLWRIGIEERNDIST